MSTISGARLKWPAIEGRAVQVDRTLVAVATIFLLVAAGFAPWWYGGRVLAPLDILNEMIEPWAEGNTQPHVHNHFTTDSVLQFLTYRIFAERSFQQDGFVGWNNLIAGGTPIYAQTTATLSDWTVQLHRILDFWIAWHLGYVGQYLLAAFGMFVFLRSQKISPIVGLLAAVAFALNSQFALLYHWRFQLGAFCWVPWLLWAMYSSRDEKRWAWLLVPLFTALAFLGGTLQTNGYLALLFVGVWAAWLMELRPWRLGPVLILTSRFAIWGILGSGLAAFALVPEVANFLDNLSAGNVRGVPGFGERPPYYSVLLIPAQMFPTLLGSPRSLDLTKLLHLDFFAIAYFGFVPAVIALRSVFHQSVPRGAQILLLLGLIAPLTPLVASLYHRLQIIYVIGGIWAFAWYWQHARPDSIDAFLKWAFYFFSLCAVVWLVASIFSLVFADALVAFGERQVAGRMEEGVGAFRAYRDWMLGRPAALIAELRIWHPRQLIPLLAAFACFGAIWLRAHVGMVTSSLVLLVALLAELVSFSWGWMTFADSKEHPLYEQTADIEAVGEIVGDGRIYLIPTEDRPRLLPPNTLSAFGIATIQQYENIRPPTMWGHFAYVDDPQTLGFIGVAHAIGYPDQRPPGEGWELDYEGERLNLWRNSHAVPRYLAIANWKLPLIERLGSDPVGAVNSLVRAGDVNVIQSTQNRRILTVPSGTGAVRVAENWSEGWYFRVGDGPHQPALEGPDRSIILPLPRLSAPTQVELLYEPRRRRIGTWISLSAVAATLMVWLIALQLGAGADRRHSRRCSQGD